MLLVSTSLWANTPKIYWYFLGCTADAFLCEDMALGQGYRYAEGRNEPRRCARPLLACYAGHP